MWDRIQNLPNLQYLISKGDADAIQELKDLYKLALGKEMKRDCSSCRLRAYTEITNLTQQKIQQMKDQKYTFKDEHALIYFGHDFVSKANLTDEIALEMVKANPTNAELFNGKFEDVKADEPKAKAKKAVDVKADEPTIEVPAETVIEPSKD